MSTASLGHSRGAKGLALLAAMALAIPLAAAQPASAGPADDFSPRLDYQFRDHEVAVGDRLDDIVAQLTFDEKVALASGTSAAAIERLGLNAGRSVAGGEGLHGIQGGNATVYPSSLALSQSWDKDLLYEVGDVIAEEGLAMAENPWWMFFGGEQWAPGAPGRLAPVLDLLRDPRYGRAYETYGEDAVLTGELGIAVTGGMNQRTADGYQQFVPALKHPLAYGTEVNRLWTNSVMPERSKNEYYVKAFKYPIAAGNAKSLMNSYPLVNGKPMSVNPLQYALLNEWTPDYEGTGHYEYTTMNDYGSGSSMWVHSQRYFADTPEGRALGVAQGAQNGQMSWSLRDYGGWTSSVDMLYEGLARGMVTEAELVENAKRALALALRLGDYDHLSLQNPYLAKGSVARDELLPANRESAFDASAEQIVLLKNDGILPLSGPSTSGAVLLGSLGEDILKDHYTGNFVYGVTIKDALENKLGAANVHYDRAVDTVAFKAPNGAYLEAADNAYSDPGASSAGGGYPPASPDTPIKATGTPGGAVPTASDTALLFEHYDFGELTQLLRTPVNDRFVQVPHTLNAAANAGLMVNNTSQPGQATLVGGNTQYVNYQTFRVVGTPDGKVGIYNQIAGNGGNNAYGESAMAYDQDDEDLNNGSYLALAAGDVVKADTGDGHVGPFRNEQHTVGPDITQAPFDRNGNDKLVDSLPNEFKFDMQVVESNTEAIAAQVAAAGAGAPIIMVVGYDPHLNAREAVDLQETGLSAQQTENIDYVTNTLGRDVILVVKTGSPMTIDATVHNNPRVKAILEIGHSGQEEGSALVAAMFDDGYRVPASGFAPAASKYSPYASYSAYPGYLPAGRRVIPAFSPAGRLSATWYAAVEDMIGASEDNPPASYRWPAYDESTNDNLSNMNGTVPKGLMTYDIIKGERTYQYFNGTPLYEFGYGLTYTDFAYTTAVSPLVGGKFTVSGTVRNTGSVASDEVVQVYSTYAGSPSRIDQANRRLIAFDRIKSIAPGETRSFSFAVDAADKIGVWDVERSAFIIEPGPYTIAVGPSSSAAAATATLNVTAGGGGQGAGTRDLTKQTLAEKFDDYSNISKDASDIELVSTSDELHSSEAVWLRQAGAWVNYQDVAIKPGTDTITVRAGADRAGSLKVFALPAGSPVSALAAATPVATIPLADTRPVSGLATGLGIGPIAVRNSPFAGHQYPGSPQGQNNLDASGNPYKDAYVTPEYKVEVATAALQAGTWDIYVQSQARGARIDWVKLGADADKTSSVAISQLYSAGSIRSKGGEVQFDAKLTPASSASPVTWSVAAPGGGATGLATISAKGLLRATGTANGTVVVTATSNGKKATLTVPVTNQLASNRVAIGGVNKTVEYPMMRTGAAFGAADAISHPKGSLAQSVVFSELFSENMASFYLPGTLLTVPVRELDWSIAGTDGLATRLATVDHLGVVQATGVGDGEVVVTASLKNNPDIEVSRTITLTNQAGRNPFRMVQTENYDDYSPALAIPPGSFMPPAVSLSIWGGGGNEAGTAARTQAGTTVAFKGMDFRGVAASEFAIRLATDQAGTAVPFTVQVWADATSAGAGGTLLATVSDTTDTSTAIYHTYKASVGSPLTGKRDVYLVFDAGLRVNWWTFATGSRIDDEAAGLLASAKAMVKGDNPAAAWSEFTGARDALAAALAASGTSQKALDQAQDKLVKALGGVTAVPVADVAALGAAIAAAEALVQADYTPASWTAVAQALSAAKAIQSSAHPVQSEVDAAVAALVRAIGGLQSAGTAAALTAAKSALTQLVAAAGALAEAEASYTAETWKAFATTLAEAQRVLADPAASPDQLAAANAALAAAMSGLVRIKVDSSAVPQVKPLTALRISQKSIRLVKGSTARPLAVAYNEDGAAGLKATWKSSKPKIVKVNTKTGKLRAVKNGTATVTATVKDASGKALKVSIKVTVVSKKVKAKSVSAAVPKTLKVGATKALAAKVTSTKATGAQVRFSSSNPQVLDVDGAGLITAKKAGKATIKVTAAGKSKSYKVTVK